MIILLHSSKTMRHPANAGAPRTTPNLLGQAQVLAEQVRSLSLDEMVTMMAVSSEVARRTAEQMVEWSAEGEQWPAVDCFTGDIYSGLHAGDLSAADRAYAEKTLYILSGLYGVLRPGDGIRPYRLEMGYKLPRPGFASLYKFWGDEVAKLIPDGPIVNLAAQEYSRVVTAHIDKTRVVTPKFLSVDPRTGEAKFIVVHAKIARGMFARWLLTERVRDVSRLRDFAEIGYEFDEAGSTPAQPLFIAKEFGGKGLSIRLEK
ncbi:YaaA family protein [Actinoplanes sp. LDG1-06]|uniref:UPF0246 protein JIG36_31720 n=1 Tax=Paractinoplanes ovalisporus TaxID=2810368 RepID=A0ABS2AJU5_9ACTN|nr:YaaA family protein [Actinoplanes ovalisporus]MBM2620092.1 YaaA family protein [Actinoplanes ovalisporus]